MSVGASANRGRIAPALSTDSRSDSDVVGEAACRNCGTPLAPEQEYCGTCGQKRIAGRITLPGIAHDLIHAFVHVDRSVLSLIRQLLVLPGAVARNFIKRAATPVGVRAIP